MKHRVPFVLALLLAAVWNHLPAQTVTPAEARAMGGCTIYPSDNIWNTRVDGLPVDKDSDVYITTLGGSAKLHPDFGSNLEYGIPINIISPFAARVPVNFEDAEDSDLGKYPAPDGVKVEATSDHHLLMLVKAPRCTLYELYSVGPILQDGSLGRNSDGSISAYAGDFVDVTSNALRSIPPNSNGRNSADAAGMEILPALVRYEEVESGEITHALRFTLPHTRAAYVWPARHAASSDSSTTLLPMGAHIRLKAGVDISRYSKSNQVILTAMKKYGLILADNGSPLYFSGVSDPRWDDDDLGKLKEIKLSDFEVVSLDDISDDLQYLYDSGRIDPLALLDK